VGEERIGGPVEVVKVLLIASQEFGAVAGQWDHEDLPEHAMPSPFPRNTDFVKALHH
jgi:hypothetical protein